MTDAQRSRQRRAFRRWLRRRRGALLLAAVLLASAVTLLSVRGYVEHQNHKTAILKLDGITRGWDVLLPVAEDPVWKSWEHDAGEVFYGLHNPYFDETVTYEENGRSGLILEDDAWLPPDVTECLCTQKPNKAGRAADYEEGSYTATLSDRPEGWHWRPLMLNSVGVYRVEYELYWFGIFRTGKKEVGYCPGEYGSGLALILVYCQDPADPDSPVMYYSDGQLLPVQAVARVWGAAFERSLAAGYAQLPLQPLCANLNVLHFPAAVYFPQPDV
ncbi:MAG: hypothetical protein LBS96_05105 [Oscillospiraceae bacterium]|jgi:hypothetical protein|nr:hypothetical protein [Oscillospiraceae bacterium]